MFHCPYCRRHFFFRFHKATWHLGLFLAGALAVTILYVLAWKLLVWVYLQVTG